MPGTVNGGRKDGDAVFAKRIDVRPWWRSILQARADCHGPGGSPPELQGAPGPCCPLHSIAAMRSDGLQGPPVHRLAAFRGELDRCEAGMSYPIANRMKPRQSDPETGGSTKLYQASNAAPVVQSAVRRLAPGSSEFGAGRKPALTVSHRSRRACQSALDATAPEQDSK